MSGLPMPPQPQTEPGIASAEGGLVVLDGPAGIAVTLTADAATQTGRNLIAAADSARQQATDQVEDRDN